MLVWYLVGLVTVDVLCLKRAKSFHCFSFGADFKLYALDYVMFVGSCPNQILLMGTLSILFTHYY